MSADDVTVPLSPTQRRLWTLAQLRPDDPFFNHPFAVDLIGPLDVATLCGALGELLQRHPALRLRIEQAGGELVQVQRPAGPVELKPVEPADVDPTAVGEWLEELTDEHAQRPFDVEGGPLLRMLLLRAGEDVHRLVVNVHHIVFDGASLELFLTELAALYDALAAGEPVPPAGETDYGAFLRRRAERDEQAATANLAYWSRRLTGAPEVLELPTGGPRAARAGHEAARHTRLIPAEVLAPVRELARRTRATPYMVLKSASDVLLSRYGTRDVLTGMALSGRNTTDSADLIGYLARPVVLRTDLSADPAFTDVVKAVRNDVLDAHDHPDLPFEDVLRAVGGERDVSYHPLYQVMFDHHVPPPERVAGGVRFVPRELRLASMKVDLNIGLVETGTGLRAELDYRASLFEPEAIAAMAAELETLLRRIGARPEARVSELCASPSEPPAEAAGSQASAECPHRLVERQAAATPSASAVTVGERSWSYRELDAAGNRIAARLREHGVDRGRRVGVCTARPPESPGAILGVLKSGAVCVPLDPALPAYLLRAVADDAEVDVVVADPLSASLFDHAHTTVLELADGWLGGPAEPVDAHAEPGDVAFVVPTSGSTGEPRLVEVEHRNLGHTLGWLRRELPGAFASTPLLEPATSIGGLIALFAPLVTGGSVAPGAGAHTALFATPPALAELVDTGAVAESVRTVLTYGAPLPEPLADRLHRAGVDQVYHLYGSAEAGGFALGARVTPGAVVTLGMPIGEAQVALVDSWGAPAAEGAVGEVYLGGPCVARGYVGEPELTARRFPLHRDSGQRLHVTGDLAYRRADGRIVFAGRAAERFTRRGSRIQPTDIEAALLAHPAVRVAAVAGDERPHAAVVAWSGTRVGEADLTAHLAEHLPRYLHPAAVTVLDALPAFPNGKPDRSRLGRLLAESVPASTGAEPPEGWLETVVSGAWADVLGRSVGVRENFFDVGGNSLLLIRLRDRLSAELGTQVQTVELFRNSTVRAMAAHLTGGMATEGDEDAARRGTARKDALRARGRARTRPQ